MSDFTTAPLQNQFETVLVGELSSSSTAPFNITVGKAIDFTPAAGGFYATLEPGTTKEEGLLISAVSGTTWTVATRGIPIAKAGTDTTTSHGGGSKIIISNHWEVYDDIATAIATKADVAGDTFTGLIQFSGTTHAGIKLISLTTAQREALTPSNGMMVYDSTLGLAYQYVSGAWGSIDTGTVTSNASTTVAGKVEIATQAELDAGTDTGDTGALLSAVPSNIAECVQESTWNFAADAGGTDSYAITLTPAIDAYVTGQRFIFTANTANTGAATLNVNAKGAKSIKRGDSTALTTGDIAAGQVVEVVYDGTNMVMTSLPNALVAGGDATSLHCHDIKIGSEASWAVTANGQTSTVAHGLGRVPKLLTITWGVGNATVNYTNLGIGTYRYDGTTHSCLQLVGDAGASSHFEATTTARYVLNSVVMFTFTVTTLDATNFVLTSANYSSGTDIIAYTWQVE